MANLTVRSALVADAAEIARIHVATWQSAYRGQLPDAFLDGMRAERRRKQWEMTLSYPAEGTRTFVAELESAVVGFCLVGRCRDEDLGPAVGELLAIYVLPECWGQGAGRALMGAGLAHLSGLGCERAVLWVLASNTRTRDWYQRQGWQLEGKRKVDRIGAVELKEIRYQRELAPSE